MQAREVVLAAGNTLGQKNIAGLRKQPKAAESDIGQPQSARTHHTLMAHPSVGGRGSLPKR